MHWKQYARPGSIHEALTTLAQNREQARIIAGGTDLILDLEEEQHSDPDVMVDVTAIPGLDQIQLDDGWLLVGAAATHAQLEESPLIRVHGTCLSEGCGVVGGPQVRNVATIGGNVAHALPAADGTIGLLALDAQAEVCALEQEQVTRTWRPLLSLFAGPGRNTLAPGEMISAFRFRPTGPGEGSAFDRIMRPQGVALPILGAAARLRLDAGGERILEASIALGPAGPVPFRATEAEQALVATGRLDEATVEAVIVAAQQQARLRTSKHRATKAYRHAMIGVLLRRILPRALARAQESL